MPLRQICIRCAEPLDECDCDEPGKLKEAPVVDYPEDDEDDKVFVTEHDLNSK